MPDYKLWSSNNQPTDELIRLVFAIANEEFEDCKLDTTDQQLLRTVTCWGHLPVLETGGRKLTNALAIVRYVSKQFQLAGTDKWEAAQVDALLEQVGDALTSFAQEKPKEVTDETSSEVENPTAVNWKSVASHAMFESFLSKLDFHISTTGNNGFAIGNHMTAADVAIFNAVDWMLRAGFTVVDTVEKYQHVAAVYHKVEQHPRIVRYLLKRSTPSA